MMTMLTENFSLAEMTGGMPPASVPQDVRDNLRFLCSDYLEPLREHCQKPIIVSSAYRPPVANSDVSSAYRPTVANSDVSSAYRPPSGTSPEGQALHGLAAVDVAPESLHYQGLAADIRCATFYEACEVLNFFIARWLHHGIGFHEAYVSFNRYWWLHLSVRRNAADNQLRVRLDWRGRIYI